MHNLSALIRKLFKLTRKLKLKKGNCYSLDDSHKYMIMPKCIEDLSSNYKEVELTLSTYKLYTSTNSLIQ